MFMFQGRLVKAAGGSLWMSRKGDVEDWNIDPEVVDGYQAVEMNVGPVGCNGRILSVVPIDLVRFRIIANVGIYVLECIGGHVDNMVLFKEKIE